ncbi:MAG: hypothetical protein A3H28_15200, partial [Acidobacteria bacterium RIFCSPLOWO2_02_FULL_61_28]
TRTAISAGDGSYRFSALPVGSYEVRVEQSGFQAAVRSGLTLTVGQEAVINFTLEVGAVTQTIAVTGEAPMVNTTSGSLGGLVDEQKVADLPLNGRNYMDLTLLQPGVSHFKNMGANPSAAGVWFSSGGAPVHSNNFLLDGARTENYQGVFSGSIAGNTLGVEGIREFRVITNNFSAEHGMSMGSQVMVVSKGGTNSFHGSLFEYLRNSALDARNFFDYKTAATPGRLPPFKRNQFGGAFGGPIKQDKTFFWGVYEALRQRLGQTIVLNVPGDGCHGPAGATITNTACPQLGAATPSVTIAPVTAPFLALFPNPNLPNNRFTHPITSPAREDFGQMRVDHTFSSNDNLFARYTITDSEVSGAIFTAAGFTSYPGFLFNRTSRNQFGTLSETHIFSPSLLNTASFSYSRTSPVLESDPPHRGPQYSFMPLEVTGGQMGNLSIGGVSAMSTYPVAPSWLLLNVFTWSDDLFYTRGKHSLKFGTLINRFRRMNYANRGYRGALTFANLANFLRGQPQSYGAFTPGSNTTRNYRYTTLGFYVQDDFRVSPGLTLNLGLRYEFSTQQHEKDGIQSAMRDLWNDKEPTVGIPFQNPTKRNISPRFGFAWDVTGDSKTAVRGGFALLYDLQPYGTVYNVLQPNWKPFSSNSNVSNPPTFTIPLTFTGGNVTNEMAMFDYNIQQQHLLSYNLTVERQLPGDMAVTLAYAGSRGINLVGTRDGNATIPQGIPVNGACVARPAGQAFNVNQPYCWLVNDPRPNPNYDSINLMTSPANSFYNSLQFGLSKRLSRGLQLQSSYTWSKLIDEPQAEATNEVASSPVQPTDYHNRKTDRGLSPYHIPHNWRFNAMYQLPGLPGATGVLGKILNGWQVGGILSLQSGNPMTVNLQTNRSRSGGRQNPANIDRPNLAPGRSNDNITSGTTPGCQGVAAGQELGTPNLYYDPCAFTVPAAGFLGNAGRNIILGPGFANLDFSLMKNTPISYLGESGRLEFRLEVFNILNRPNFRFPARTAFAGTADVQAPLSNAGVITQTDGTSRQLQFALRLLF